jgi:ATP-dependent DNA helicase RecQ
MWNYGTALKCRHRMLVHYFGQNLPDGPCGACDVCEGNLDVIDDALIVGQKILSCVVRLQQRFGADYTSLVLVGSKDERIKRNYHDNLSTYGLLSDHPKRVVRDWIEQMVDRGYLKKAGEFSVLHVTSEGREVLSGNVTPQLLKPPEKRVAKRTRAAPAASRVEPDAPVNEDVMSALRRLRSDIAKRRRVPAYVVFGDVTLRELAATCPTTSDELLSVRGIGEARRKKYGDDILAVIKQHAGA